MPCVGFESTILVSERAKTVHALDRSATMTGGHALLCCNNGVEDIPNDYDLTRLQYLHMQQVYQKGGCVTLWIVVFDS
jgi:hypothetical protein